MRRYFSLLLALVLLLPGCGGAQPPEDTSGGQSSEILGQNAEITGQDAETIARVMLAYLDENEDLSALTWYVEPSDVEGYIQDFYKLEDIPPLDGAIARVEGARAFGGCGGGDRRPPGVPDGPAGSLYRISPRSGGVDRQRPYP